MCSGKIHEFFYNFSDFYQLKTIGSPQWSLSKTNPFHIATLISFCSSIVVTPVCYAAIYRLQSHFEEEPVHLFSILSRFRNRHDEKVAGISRSAKVLRKRRNLVSMRFNMINWLLETISIILVMVEDNVFLSILYLLVTSCGTPLVFFKVVMFFQVRTGFPQKLTRSKGSVNLSQGSVNLVVLCKVYQGLS